MILVRESFVPWITLRVVEDQAGIDPWWWRHDAIVFETDLESEWIERYLQLMRMALELSGFLCLDMIYQNNHKLRSILHTNSDQTIQRLRINKKGLIIKTEKYYEYI